MNLIEMIRKTYLSKILNINNLNEINPKEISAKLITEQILLII